MVRRLCPGSGLAGLDFSQPGWGGRRHCRRAAVGRAVCAVAVVCRPAVAALAGSAAFRGPLDGICLEILCRLAAPLGRSRDTGGNGGCRGLGPVAARRRVGRWDSNREYRRRSRRRADLSADPLEKGIAAVGGALSAGGGLCGATAAGGAGGGPAGRGPAGRSAGSGSRQCRSGQLCGGRGHPGGDHLDFSANRHPLERRRLAGLRRHFLYHLDGSLHHFLQQLGRPVQRQLAGNGLLDCPAGSGPGQPALVLLLGRLVGVRTAADNFRGYRRGGFPAAAGRVRHSFDSLGRRQPAGLHYRQ